MRITVATSQQISAKLVIGLAVACLGGTILGQSPFGQITGSVENEKGAPVSGAYVTIVGQGGAPFRSSTRSGGGGSFSISSVPAGTFRICVQSRGKVFLDPCDWTASPPVATVAVGRATAVPPIQVVTGYTLRVRLQDAGGTLAANERKTKGAHVLTGVWRENGLFVPLEVVRTGGNGRDYQLQIPYETNLTLSLFSNSFVLGDPSGSATVKGKGLSLPVRVGAGAAARTYTFAVTGMR